MKIKVGIYDILYSGSILIERENPIEFDIPDGDKNPMKLFISLIEDKNEKLNSMKSSLKNETTLEIKLYNFENGGMSGGGLKKPVKIGIVNDRFFYFSFQLAFNAGILMPLFNYTFYLGEKEVDGGK